MDYQNSIAHLDQNRQGLPWQLAICSMHLKKAADKNDNGYAMIFNFNFAINGTYQKLIGLILNAREKILLKHFKAPCNQIFSSNEVL